MEIRVELYNKMTYIKYIITKWYVVLHYNKKNVGLSTFLSIKENIIVKIKNITLLLCVYYVLID